jgi:hypothetical protein
VGVASFDKRDVEPTGCVRERVANSWDVTLRDEDVERYLYKGEKGEEVPVERGVKTVSTDP